MRCDDEDEEVEQEEFNNKTENDERYNFDKNKGRMKATTGGPTISGVSRQTAKDDESYNKSDNNENSKKG